MKPVISKLLTIIFVLLLVFTSTGTLHSFPEERTTKNPVELGKVKWLRDLTKATAEAKKAGKPVYIMFQEVPG